VKSSEYPEQDARTVPFQSEAKEKVLVRAEAETPGRYLDLPPAPEERHLIRNLVWGIALLVIAAIAFWMGLYYAGGAAVRTLAACLVTFGVVYLLLHLNVLRQRYGGLVALGLVALIGACIPFVEGGFRRLDDLARERLAGQTPSLAAANSVPPPPPTLATAPPAPPTIPLPPEDLPDSALEPAVAAKGASKASRAIAANEPTKAPLQTKQIGDGPLRELIVPEPPAGSAKLIRVKEDVKVDLGGRPTVIRGGTIAPFKELADGQVTFLAGDHEISIDMGLVTFTGATKEKTEDINLLAQQEAMRRYPRLRDTTSTEHNLYMIRVTEFKNAPEMKEVFADPKWPLVIAEQLAQQEGWKRADAPADDATIDDPTAPSPTPPQAPGADPVPTDKKEGAAPEIPANELPAKNELLLPSKLPPIPSIPQESEPPPAK
jgi:hypothetical protein